jgi:hypothetical protein
MRSILVIAFSKCEINIRAPRKKARVFRAAFSGSQPQGNPSPEGLLFLEVEEMKKQAIVLCNYLIATIEQLLTENLSENELIRSKEIVKIAKKIVERWIYADQLFR